MPITPSLTNTTNAPREPIVFTCNEKKRLIRETLQEIVDDILTDDALLS